MKLSSKMLVSNTYQIQIENCEKPQLHKICAASFRHQQEPKLKQQSKV